MADVAAPSVRYVFERRLGHGSSGEVVLARDTLLGRKVALKSLHGAEPEALATEARALASLRHPNIVQVFDLVSINGVQFLVMEYVRGKTLREVLGEGPLPPALAIGYTVEVARALAHAHREGIVHNDVKPDNIIIDRDGEARLTDFGVARNNAATLLPGETETIAGSLPYLAPELIQGADPGPRSDLYSLAVTLYELATGSLPFSGEGAAGIAQRFAGPPPGLHQTSGLWHGLPDVLECALAPSPVRRYRDADAFADALVELPKRHSWPAAVVAGPRPRRVGAAHGLGHRRRLLLGGAIALGGLGLLGAAAALALRDSSEASTSEPPTSVAGASTAEGGSAAVVSDDAATPTPPALAPPSATAVPPRAQDKDRAIVPPGQRNEKDDDKDDKDEKKKDDKKRD